MLYARNVLQSLYDDAKTDEERKKLLDGLVINASVNHFSHISDSNTTVSKPNISCRHSWTLTAEADFKMVGVTLDILDTVEKATKELVDNIIDARDFKVLESYAQIQQVLGSKGKTLMNDNTRSIIKAMPELSQSVYDALTFTDTPNNDVSIFSMESRYIIKIPHLGSAFRVDITESTFDSKAKPVYKAEIDFNWDFEGLKVYLINKSML